MTLIAFYRAPEAMVLLGDLMLSAKNNQVVPDLPAIFEDGFAIKNPDLVGLDQKLVQLSDHVVIAWAGRRAIAQKAILEVAQRTNEVRTVKDCFDIIDASVTKDEYPEVAFISCVIDPDKNSITMGSRRTEKKQWGPQHEIWFRGSGKYHFLKKITFQVVAKKGNPNGMHEAIVSLLQRASIAFFEEMVQGTTHESLYGGSFEIAVPKGNTLEKIPYSTFFWDFIDDGIRFRELAFSLQYQGRRLIINRLRRDENNKPQIRQFPVGSVLDDFYGDCLPPASIDTYFCLHHFFPAGVKTFDKGRTIVHAGNIHPLRPTLIDQKGTMKVPVIPDSYLRDLLRLLNRKL